MTLLLAEAVTLTALLFLTAIPVTVTALGSASTIAVSPSSSTVCGVVAAAGDSPRSIRCAHLNSTSSFPILPNASFQSLSGGARFLCGLRSGGSAFFCWSSDNLIKKRVYSGPVTYSDLTVGDNQIAAVSTNGVRFWRGDGSFPVAVNGSYRSLTSGDGFTCGIDGATGSVRCWGRSGGRIETAFANASMSYISAGGAHVCGVAAAGALLCGGANASGQSNPPAGSEFGGFSGLALGDNHTCAIRTSDKSVLCWGGAGAGGEFAPVNSTQFELLAAGGDVTCGVTTLDFSVICWRADPSNPSVRALPLPKVLPGICVEQVVSNCSCGIFPDSASLCSGSRVICSTCPSSSPSPSPSASPTPPSSKKSTSKLWLVFAIVGGVGILIGVCTVVYCLWTRIFRRKKVHNSVQPTIAAAGNPAVRRSPTTSPSASRSRIFGRQGSRAMRRQRSGPSSFKDRAEQFTFSELAALTDNFAPENKIGAGSFGTVYKAKLPDGRDVAIKRSESEPKTRKLQEKESVFRSELEFLSRLHHKHLVGLVGFCDDEEERLLVFDYMKNGALYDHLHSDGHEHSKVVSSWKIRIKVLLDAARGIEYLHNYAVPPIIHRDIKSSNILLDANWVARVSDFGLSLMGPESKGDHLRMRAAGTVGYMDPEYYGLHHLTVKSDVYGLGVVMLEVLTGKRAIFRSRSAEEGGGGEPVSVVDYAVPSIVAGEVAKVLDERAGAAGAGEAEAVELVAYTAVHCISLEGKDRPSIADIVSNLESALALCEHSHDSISSASFSLGSD